MRDPGQLEQRGRGLRGPGRMDRARLHVPPVWPGCCRARGTDRYDQLVIPVTPRQTTRYRPASGRSSPPSACGAAASASWAAPAFAWRPASAAPPPCDAGRLRLRGRHRLPDPAWRPVSSAALPCEGSPSAQAGGLSEAHAALRRPASVSAALRRPASVSAALRRPASVSAALRRPASVSAALRRPASVSAALRRPASVSVALRRPASALAPAPSQVLGKEPISGG